MNKKEAELKEITIYWWNMGKKTLDFEGSYKDYFLKRDIKVKEITHKISKVKGFKFIIPLSSCVATLEIFRYDYAECCDEAIKIFLTLLGDKTLFRGRYGRGYRINWW